MNRSSANTIKSFLRLACLFVILFYFISNYIVSVYETEGNSMYPLLDQDDRVVADRLVYKMADIQRNDIVVFYSPAEPQKCYIKRIIGLPGESIRFENGDVYIDGRKQLEPFLTDEMRSFETIETRVIPLGHYFVAGDNRGSSNDSRTWAMQSNTWPFVGERYILGKIRFRIWPVTRTGRIHSQQAGAISVQFSVKSCRL